jgi:hypothetical protein
MVRRFLLAQAEKLPLIGSLGFAVEIARFGSEWQGDRLKAGQRYFQPPFISRAFTFTPL